jgi:hypothetical protein
MNNTSPIFWNVTPRSPVEVNRRFGGAHLDLSWFLGLLLYPEDEGHIFLRNFGLTFAGLLGVIAQKIELFIIIAVRTSNRTKL